MKLIVLYLIFYWILLAFVGVLLLSGWLSECLEEDYSLPISCGLLGGLGGIIYCLRAVYLNRAVRKNWDADWHIWYYIRPIVSMLCGFASFLFLKAGLLVLEASQNQSSTNLGFYALAFIAGLNVDNFIAKIENIAEATWGIQKSKAYRDFSDKDDKKEKE